MAHAYVGSNPTPSTTSDPGQDGGSKCMRCAGVAQWQSSSLPSWLCGFDSRHPLQHPGQRLRPAAAVRGPQWTSMVHLRRSSLACRAVSAGRASLHSRSAGPAGPMRCRGRAGRRAAAEAWLGSCRSPACRPSARRQVGGARPGADQEAACDAVAQPAPPCLTHHRAARRRSNTVAAGAAAAWESG